MAANAGLTGLSRRHGVKVGAGSMLSVEEVALAVGQEIGHSSVKSAACMNRAVVLFLEKVEQANRLVETGITGGAVRPGDSADAAVGIDYFVQRAAVHQR
ncbi:hypothetical protein D4764_22G0006280 [Takifugu flavidus]|uniref:Uncharacterized protein n=1 Tax=Takifugu flavidus TaxID=433684 RepID=A0A5C6NEK5_9TELE|nr:hypothetical protein D4764_22G0006280 [Takifugu flavidus]